jgi:hypothetical protein
MVAEDGPETEGVPVIAPVEALSVRPAGKEPVVTDQAYGASPPDAEFTRLYAEPRIGVSALTGLITRGVRTMSVLEMLAVCGVAAESET